MLFDSHAHLNHDGFSEKQRLDFIEKIKESEVSRVMDIGVNLESSYMAAKHAEEYDWCYATVGCHPYDVDEMDDMGLYALETLAKKEKVMAIGEIGLDFYREITDFEKQKYWFRKQIQLANKLMLPIVIHSRDADQAVMDILKEEGAFSEERKRHFGDARVLLHCYSGSAEFAKQYVKLGATISIAGPVTFKNGKKLVSVVEEIDIKNLLIETDSPFLTPEPFRGKRNNPANVKYVCNKVAEIKGMEYEEVAKITYENAKRFFNIPK